MQPLMRPRIILHTPSTLMIATTVVYEWLTVLLIIHVCKKGLLTIEAIADKWRFDHEQTTLNTLQYTKRILKFCSTNRNLAYRLLHFGHICYS